MNTIEYFKEHFDQLQAKEPGSNLETIRLRSFNEFAERGIPTLRNEEWKYTRIGSLFNKEYDFPFYEENISANDINAVRLPGHEDANELVFINGNFSKTFSKILSADLIALPIEIAAQNEYSELVKQHLGHSSYYLKDGINALNTAFVHGGVFIHVEKGKAPEHPVYIYNITDARTVNVLAQPRSLVHIHENAQVQIVETYTTIGSSASFTNQVMEIIVEQNAIVEYYKIQNDASHASQVSTTHIRQVGKSFTHTVTISLNGDIVRNNLNVVMEADHCEAHMYGLYFQSGKTHVDNHTVVDNRSPHCLSNQLYKGILNDDATGVFNGKIFVRQIAQKTNAYQSNKNILLSEGATINAKPQLEIFADDVKCSHGCTVGKLDDEGLFYLRSRGISEKMARALLVQAFAVDVLEHIKPAAIRLYVDQIISQRLEFPIPHEEEDVV